MQQTASRRKIDGLYRRAPIRVPEVNAPKNESVSKVQHEKTAKKSITIPATYISRSLFSVVTPIIGGSIVTVVIILLAWPFIPALIFKVDQKNLRIHAAAVHSKISSYSVPESMPPKENRLVIAGIGIDAPIIEGAGERALDAGAWHRPGTGNPEKGGNAVIAGHRFRYTLGNNTFYSLDKVSAGDEIVVFWNQKKYRYQVLEQKTVSATALEIEAPTAEPRLTLYTCTPLWTAKDRLVIIAKPSST